jgi:hypothetical protein
MVTITNESYTYVSSKLVLKLSFSMKFNNLHFSHLCKIAEFHTENACSGVLFKHLRRRFCRWNKQLPSVAGYCLQANGSACVDFGCTHPIDELFWNLLIYLLGFFSKYECHVTDLIMFLYHFVFLRLSLAFLYHEVSYHYEMKKKNPIHMINFLNEIYLINIQIISFNSFDSY